MGIGIFDRLGFPASMSNNTIGFSQDTQNSLNSMPQILTTWQMEDIANNTTNGYFQNPVSTVSSQINDMLQNIAYYSAANAEYSSITLAVTSLLDSNTVNNFIQHTDRLSGVQEMTANTVHLPHFQNCIGLGKALTYIVYQSDGISNNAVMMGNFGSLYTGNTLALTYSSLTASNTQIGLNNLTPSQIVTITNQIDSTNTYINTCIDQDVNYFANCNTVLTDYNSVKGLGHMGDTEKNLVNTLVGTNKLKTRIS